MALFSMPITLLGMASPFAVRLGVDSVDKAGEVAGRLYALSTAGRILGTFMPVVFLIPNIGTRRTMLATAGVLGTGAAPRLGRRYVLVPAAIVAVIALIPPGLVKPGPGVIFEGESAVPVHPGVSRSPARPRPAPQRGLGRALGLVSPAASSPAATGISSCSRRFCMARAASVRWR